MAQAVDPSVVRDLARHGTAGGQRLRVAGQEPGGPCGQGWRRKAPLRRRPGPIAWIGVGKRHVEPCPERAPEEVLPFEKRSESDGGPGAEVPSEAPRRIDACEKGRLPGAALGCSFRGEDRVQREGYGSPTALRVELSGFGLNEGGYRTEKVLEGGEVRPQERIARRIGRPDPDPVQEDKEYSANRDQDGSTTLKSTVT